MLNRRGFLGSLAALVAAPFVPMPAPRVPVSMVQLARAVDRQTGISIRFIRQYDAAADRMPSAFDVKMFRHMPELARRIDG